MPTAVVLLSGGLDSYTAAAMAREEGYELIALTVSYGQRHSVELSAAKAVGRWLGVREHCFQVTTHHRDTESTELHGGLTFWKPC